MGRAVVLWIVGTLLIPGFCRAQEPNKPQTTGVSSANAAQEIRSRSEGVGMFKLHWLEAGPADGLPVLLLHGVGSTTTPSRTLGS